MNYLKQFLWRRKGMLLGTMVLLVGQVVGTLLIPFLIADMIDVGIMNGDMEAIKLIAVSMIFVVFITALISVGACYYCAAVGSAFGKEMREALFRKSQMLSQKDFDSLSTSSLITRSTSDISNIQQTLIMGFQMILPAPLICIAAIVMTALVSPSLAWMLVVVIVGFLAVIVVIMKRSQILSEQTQVRMDRINQVVRESIVGIRVIRAFNNSQYERKRSDDSFAEYASTVISLNRIFAVMNPVVWGLMGLTMAAIVGLGGYSAANGVMAIGEITSVSEYTILSLAYLIMACFSFVTIPKMVACLHRLSEVLDMKIEIKDSLEPVKPDDRIDRLSFEDVTFSYHGAQLPVLHHLNFKCTSGQTTAIIGGTGSGKSTIASILQRLHDIDSGAICLNHTPIANMTQHDLRDQIAYVPQKAFLFSGTISDNLRMGKKTASIEQMRRAARIAQAEEFIDSLPDGFEAPVSQAGKNFSGGQKQRLAIARALIKEAPVLVFDDSFSALDFKTDAALRKSLKEELKDSIILIIAQRISTIVDADQIIVVDEGHIVQIGKHEELLKTCSVYQEIAKSQLAQKEELVS